MPPPHWDTFGIFPSVHLKEGVRLIEVCKNCPMFVQRLFCTVIKFHVVEEAKEAVLYFVLLGELLTAKCIDSSSLIDYSTYFKDVIQYYRKIHYLTREFHVKLHAKTDIARIASLVFNSQFHTKYLASLTNQNSRFYSVMRFYTILSIHPVSA